jgi:hypothetical protein
MQPQRPTGVTILAILAIIGGVLGLCGGIGGVLGGSFISSLGANASVVFFFSLISLILGVGDLAFGIGALQLKPWAWTLGVGLEGISILYEIVSVALQANSVASAVFGIVISGIVIYYLFQPNVQQAFGRVASR